MSFEYYDASGLAVGADGVFIPAASLTGVSASEFAAIQPAHLKFSKTILGMLEKIYAVLNPTAFAKLGFAVTKSTNASGLDRLTNTFSLTFQKVANEKTNSITQIPVPTTGVNTGVGDFSLVDIFPSATKLASGANTPSAGVLIPTSLVAEYTSLTHAGLTISGSSDNRDWLAGFMLWVGNSATIRGASQASAITARSVSSASATIIPAQFVQTTDPTSGLLAADLPVLSLLQRVVSVSVELELNPSAQTFDVRSATA